MDQETCISGNNIPGQTEAKVPEWDELIERHAESGMPASKYCRTHGINYKLFLYHRRRLRRQCAGAESCSSGFIPATISGTGGTRLILPHGVVLETEHIPEASWMAELMKAF